MKQLLITTILLLAYSINNICIGQTEFAPVGARWLYEKVFYSYTGEEESRSYIEIISKSDTIIDGLSCKKIGIKEILVEEGLEFNETSFLCQKNDSIFRIEKNNKHLLFNFFLNKSDTLYIDTTKYLYYVVDSIYIDTIDLQVLRKQKASLYCGDNTSSFNQIEILERVGPIESLLQSISYLLFPDYECILDVIPSIKFICYSDNLIEYNPNSNILCDSLLTKNKNTSLNTEFFKIYPNPSNGDFFIENLLLSPDPFSIELYSINGMKICATETVIDSYFLFRLPNIPSGIYILRLKSGKLLNFSTLIIR
ncbi:MAG: T9SS type A sorting domain-containing protein [Saprospiraceae bacterium]|nr:T9SS type A sorting domain-containing protein [Saprospiraceae bacterium]